MIDLHTHSTFSDGELTPKNLIELALKNGINTFSITDHDTLLGNKEVMKIIKNYDINYITGIELSAKVDKGRMHILGYDIDINVDIAKLATLLILNQGESADIRTLLSAGGEIFHKSMSCGVETTMDTVNDQMFTELCLDDCYDDVSCYRLWEF